MDNLMSSGGYADMTICNYRKDDVLLRCTVHCIPLMDIVGEASEKSDKKMQVSHIGMMIQDALIEVISPQMCNYESYDLDEVGMPLDRRENCNVYSKCGDLAAPSIKYWRTMFGNGASAATFSLSLTLRYMLRSQAPLILVDS
jgi:hypothetical protein